MPVTGFLGCQQLSELRVELHNEAYKESNPAMHKAGYWLGHKVVTMASLPVHAAEFALSTLVGTATTAVFFSINMLVFAATLGNKTHRIPTGFCYFGEGSLHGAWGVIRNGYELVYDTGNLVYQGYRVARHITYAMGLADCFRVIMQTIRKVFNFCIGRIAQGIDKAKEVEPDSGNGKLPFLGEMNNGMKSLREWDHERPFSKIIGHYAGSIVAIPLNAVVGIATATLSLAGLAVVVAKVAIYALTTINIPLPTGLGVTGKIAAESLWDAAADISVDGIDIFVTTYKVASVLRVTDVVMGIFSLFAYIPAALIG